MNFKPKWPKFKFDNGLRDEYMVWILPLPPWRAQFPTRRISEWKVYLIFYYFIYFQNTEPPTIIKSRLTYFTCCLIDAFLSDQTLPQGHVRWQADLHLFVSLFVIWIHLFCPKQCSTRAMQTKGGMLYLDILMPADLHTLHGIYIAY